MQPYIPLQDPCSTTPLAHSSFTEDTLITILGCAQAIIKLGLGLVSLFRGQKLENLSYRSDFHTADSYSQSEHEYCTNPINLSVTHHRGSKINEILRGHRSQGPAMKPPGQTEDEQNWVPLILEIEFFPPLSLSTSMDRVWNLTICYSFTPQGSLSFRWNFLAVTLSLVKWWNQNFIMMVTGHRVWWIDWISTVCCFWVFLAC